MKNILIVLSLLIFASCSPKEESKVEGEFSYSKILGYWEYVDEDELSGRAIEFLTESSGNIAVVTDSSIGQTTNYPKDFTNSTMKLYEFDMAHYRVIEFSFIDSKSIRFCFQGDSSSCAIYKKKTEVHPILQ